jgi:alpha-beta hydrolase superfamily lysophospholipase
MLLSVKSACAIWSGVRYRVVRLDLRGHDNSQIPKLADDFSLSLLVSDALALLDLIGADRAHIVGNSAGGYVSQQLAINHPKRVKLLFQSFFMPIMIPRCDDGDAGRAPRGRLCCSAMVMAAGSPMSRRTPPPSRG